jgi:hypothetical protein
MAFGECRQKWWVNVGESGESLQKCLLVWASLASPHKSAWQMSASLASTCQATWQMLAQARMIRWVILCTNKIFYKYKTVLPTLAKLANLGKFGLHLPNLPFASLASPCKTVWWMSASLASIKDFWRRPFWWMQELAKNENFLWVLAFTKLARE